jgi:hypothetical protein
MPMDSILMCSNILYVQCRCRKQFEMAVTLNNDFTTSF